MSLLSRVRRGRVSRPIATSVAAGRPSSQVVETRSARPGLTARCWKARDCADKLCRDSGRAISMT
jgi:hypothetical protein